MPCVYLPMCAPVWWQNAGLEEGNTLYAQGGISAVLDARDSVDSHVQDTLNAGGGLCNEEVVRLVVEHGPDNIRWLFEEGVEFTRTPATGSSGYHLTREGGHSHRRVVHAADATGQEVETTLVRQLDAHPNVSVFEHHIAVDLISADHRDGRRLQRRCHGAYLLGIKTDKVVAVSARCVVLATGGASKVYLYTSNPDVATGDGIAMAWRAGCRVANMEFNQFHPTCLFHPAAKSFLISEAVRGEGGKLLLPDGSRFMERFDERAELAPRDIVARAIDHEMKRQGIDSVFLDISHKPADEIETSVPHDPPTLHGLGLRYAQAAPAGGPGGALHLRRRKNRPPRKDRCGRPVRDRRDRLYRAARRQPHGQQLPARMPGVRRGRAGRHPARTRA